MSNYKQVPQGGPIENPFGLDISKITDLISAREITQLKKYGGLKEIVSSLKTDVKNGLSAEEEAKGYDVRRAIFGRNVFEKPPPKTIFRLFFEALQDTTIIILSIAAIVSIILGVAVPHPDEELGAWIEGLAILIAVFIVASVTSFNNWSKEKQFRKLNDQKDNKLIRVMRGGKETQVSIFEINVGDIVVLDTGCQIAADGLFLEGHELKVDESVMTGEPDAVKKSAQAPFMLSGCVVTEGVGKMLVLAIGENSEWGKTMKKLQTEVEDTPLQKKLETMAGQIGKVGLVVAAMTTTVLIIYAIVKWADPDQPDYHGWPNFVMDLVSAIIIGITVIVVAVPEGLPLAVTISLAYSMKQMLSDQNLVRHLSACETMGNATNICSDKTGTLTENRMTVVKGWIADKEFDIEPDSKNPVPIGKKDLPSLAFDTLTQNICANSTSEYVKEEGKKTKYIGSPTECALLMFNNESFEGDYTASRKKLKIQQLFPFSSKLKRMSCIIANDKNSRLLTKGAAEQVLDLCNTYVNKDGEVVELTPKMKKKILGLVSTYASQALRNIVLAYKDLPQYEKDYPFAPDDNMTLIGLTGIMDPIRKEVPPAVALCQRAGIIVRMVTGDNIDTAIAIAKKCNILTDGIAMEGKDFAALTFDELDDILPRLQVLARSSPTDKFTLVTRLIHNGEVVAVTGDGTNDAPALKAADVGLAMGIAGTEVAKEASDIIIMDDNFKSIEKSVLWGRSVYDNIRKFLQFQLTVNVVALVTVFVGAITGRGEPLTAVQLLWVNLIMDTMAALALGTEKPTPSLLFRKPYGRDTSLLSNVMIRNIAGQSMFQIAVLFFLMYQGHLIWDVGAESSVQHYTMVFNTFVFCQVFNEINSRKVNDEFNVVQNFFTNWLFLFIILFTIVFQVLFVEFGGGFTKTTHLTWDQWLSCIGIASVCLPLSRVIAVIPVPKSADEIKPNPNDRTGKSVVDIQDNEFEMK